MIHEEMTTEERYSEQGYAPAVLVGWISDHQFPKGDTPEGMLAALVSLILRNPDGLSRNMMRCMKKCPICGGFVFLNADGTATVYFTEDELARDKPTLPQSLMLGSDELWIPRGNGEFIVSPSLVPHYIGVHDYCPPPEFWSAVVANQP